MGFQRSVESELTPAKRSKHSVLAGGGEMGALMRSMDWSRTAVGPVEAWPQSLRTALSILLETGFPMYIAWGKDDAHLVKPVEFDELQSWLVVS
jgi:hypothetical protein